MIAVAPYHVSYIGIYPLCKLRIIIPELPSGSIDYHKQPEFVAGIHESGILRTVGVSYHLETGVAQFFGIAPVGGVGHRVAHDRKILMAVCADKRLTVWLAVEIEALLAFEFHAPYTQTLHKGICLPSLRISDTYFKMV